MMNKSYSGRRLYIVSLIFSLAFSFFNAYIFMLETVSDSLNRKYVFLWNMLLLTAAVFFAVKALYAGLPVIGSYLFRHSEEKSENDIRYFLTAELILLLFWIPVFLAYFPGIFSYDVGWQIPQYVQGYTTHHPLVHTLYLIFFYYLVGEKCFGNVTIGVALAVILQMLVFSLAVSFIHLFLYRLKLRRCIRYALIILSGILPTFSMLSISLTKDVYFAVFFGTLFTLLCYRVKLKNYYNKLYHILYVISVTGCILSRNNGLHVVILAVTGLFFISFRHSEYRSLFLKTAAGLIAAVIINQALCIGLHAVKGNPAEALSVPIQQMSCAYHDHADRLSPEDVTALREFLPHIDEYNPVCSDAVKQETAISGHFRAFLSLYIKLGLKCPGSYIKGFCQLDAGYLGITDVTFDRIYGMQDGRGLLLSRVDQGYGVEHTSYLKRLESLYESLYSDNEYHYVIGLDLLCKPAFYMWIILFIIAGAIVWKCRDIVIPSLFLLPLLLTIIAGPCVLVRYALPYIICIPQYCSLVLCSE